ncbi:hypothetical protein D3C80_2198080 [compost metagenome]
MHRTGKDRHHLDRRQMRKTGGHQHQQDRLESDAGPQLVESIELAPEFQDRHGNGIEGK